MVSGDRQDCRLDHGGSNGESVRFVSLDEGALASGVIHHIFVCDPEGNRNDDLVARIDQGLGEIEDDVLATHRHDAFRRLVTGAEIRLVPLDDSLFQLGGSARGSVLGEILIERANGRGGFAL